MASEWVHLSIIWLQLLASLCTSPFCWYLVGISWDVSQLHYLNPRPAQEFFVINLVAHVEAKLRGPKLYDQNLSSRILREKKVLGPKIWDQNFMTNILRPQYWDQNLGLRFWGDQNSGATVWVAKRCQSENMRVLITHLLTLPWQFSSLGIFLFTPWG